MSAPLSPIQSLTKIPFKNVDAQDAPAFAVMQVTGLVVEDGVTFLTCARVSATLASEFAVNGPWRVKAGEKGTCYRQGDLRVAFDGGSPQPGESWGVRANQWTLSRGYPSIITVHGVHNAANKILHGRLTPLASVVGVPTAGLASLIGGLPGSGWVAVQAWDGTSFAPAEPAMQFLGTNVSTSTVNPGELVQFVASNGLWVVDVQAIALVRFELTADLIYGVHPTADNAKVLVYSSGSYSPTGATIRVFDWTNFGSGAYGSWDGKAPNVSPARSGYQGWAVLKADSAHYEIVWMEHPARLISFRLYQQLTTAQASQSNCAVLTFWDGRDPDPAGSNITVYNLVTDYSGVYKFAGDANAVGYAIWNEKLGHYQICALEGDGRRWVVFKNVNDSAVPACGAMTDTGITNHANGHTNTRPVMTTSKPDDTFHRTFWINGYASVASNGFGVCCSSESPCEALVTSSSVANGESVGPSPGSWALSRRRPGATVIGVTVAGTPWALVKQENVVQLLAKMTQDLANDTDSGTSSTSGYEIWVGVAGSEFDGGWTTVPPARNRQGYTILTDSMVMLVWLNNHWEIVPFADGSVVIGKLDGSLSRGGSATVSVWSGGGGSESDSGANITARDWLMKSGATAIAAGKKVVCRLINGTWYVTEAECA